MSSVQTSPSPQETSAAEVLLRALQAHGIDFFFANPGTDFAPVIEAFARSRKQGVDVPRPMVIPHENTAVSMAHGVYMVSGQPQAVMVHTTVGTGNTLNTLINASRDHVPMMLLAGRTPITEGDAHGGRSRHIHWAQEMFDQAGLVREVVKWDYELRTPDQTADVVARAMEIMMASPPGPVYLMLPREVVGSSVRLSNAPLVTRAVPTAPYPDPHAIETLAKMIVAAERPVIVAANSGRTVAGFEALTNLAEDFALPVISYNHRHLCISWDHAMSQGFKPGPLVKDADLILVVDCDVPWIVQYDQPPSADCRVAHVGVDPSFARYPMRSYRSDIAIAGDTAVILDALDAVLERLVGGKDPKIAERRRALVTRHAKLREDWAKTSTAAGKGEAIKPEWLSRCLGDALSKDAIVVNEYPLMAEHCRRELPGTYFGLSPAGGLGWGFGAALGAKLAAPDRLVVATLGDGAYVFANPTACHWVAAKHNLPVLTVVFNNQLYGAVRRATLSMYETGVAAEDDARLLADLSPSPAFEMLVEASGGYGECVTKPGDVPAAIQRALHVVTVEKRQALLNVMCQY
jgi:acetolactate synthase I/II/III large subunit